LLCLMHWREGGLDAHTAIVPDMKFTSRHVLLVWALATPSLFAQQPPVTGRVPEAEMAQALIATKGFLRQAEHDTLNPQIALMRDNLLNGRLQPQLREFLKDQLYCMALAVDPGSLWKRDMDFGPVNYALLDGTNSCARGEWRGRTYELVMKQHVLTKAEAR
jgi:hypothetical protein